MEYAAIHHTRRTPIREVLKNLIVLALCRFSNQQIPYAPLPLDPLRHLHVDV